jgi:hypothetical protein
MAEQRDRDTDVTQAPSQQVTEAPSQQVTQAQSQHRRPTRMTEEYVRPRSQ